MLFLEDNNKMFCNNYYLPQDMQVLSLFIYGQAMHFHTRKYLPIVSIQVFKKEKRKITKE